MSTRSRKGNGNGKPPRPDETTGSLEHRAVCPAAALHRAIADIMKPVIVAHGIEDGATEAVLRPMSELLHTFAEMILLQDPGPLMVDVLEKMRKVPHGEWVKGKEGKEVEYVSEPERHEW
jgi:hypothetical protein